MADKDITYSRLHSGRRYYCHPADGITLYRCPNTNLSRLGNPFYCAQTWLLSGAVVFVGYLSAPGIYKKDQKMDGRYKKRAS